jgi:hypothetical protein
MKRFITNQLVSAAIGLATFAVIGTAPALAQSRDHTGSMMPAYYDESGKQVTGTWAPEATAQSTTQSPRGLYAQARLPRHRHHVQ